MIHRFVHSVFVALLLANLVVAQSKPEDLLNKTKTDQAILTQRLEVKLRDALDEARRLQATSPVRAGNTLKSALSALEDPLIPAHFRADWTARLNTQIRLIETGNRVQTPEQISPEKRQIKEADIKRAKAAQEEYSEVKRGVDTIAALVKSGNVPQAQQEVAALIKRFPDNPAALVLTDSLSMNQRLTDARFLVEQQKQGYLLAMRSIDKSAIPIKDDVEFDKERWIEITQKRNKPTLTKKEQELLKSLDSPITIGYKNAPFEEVMTFLSNKTGQNIVVGKETMAQAMIESNTPVSITLNGGAVKTALRKVLQDYGLTYVIRNETIQVVTLEQARSMLVTRVYYLGDLIRGVGAIGGAAALEFGPQVDMLQTQDNAGRIIEMIKTIDPDSWKDRGGAGSISFNLPSMSIIVRQTAEVHAKLGGALGR